MKRMILPLAMIEIGLSDRQLLSFILRKARYQLASAFHYRERQVVVAFATYGPAFTLLSAR